MPIIRTRFVAVGDLRQVALRDGARAILGEASRRSHCVGWDRRRATRKIWLPPMPSSGLRDDVAVQPSMKAWMSAGSRATSVVMVNRGNSVIAIFSGWSRTARGSLNTRTPACAARARAARWR